MTVGIKYCGGCNPRYDRVAAARRLEAAFPGLTFTPARPGAGALPVPLVPPAPSQD